MTATYTLPWALPRAPSQVPVAAAEAVRGYDLAFDRRYTPLAPPLPPGGAGQLPPVWWDGTDISPGWVDDQFTAVVENVEGWYDTPELNGNDTDRTLTDGVERGPKILGPRTITITGAAAGPFGQLIALRDMLAGLAARRTEGSLTIGEPATGRRLTAATRADSDTFGFTFLGGNRGFRWTVTLTAADPLLYEDNWRTVRLVNTAAGSGRLYPRTFPWRYRLPAMPNSAWLDNPGNADAPVYALYAGQLDDGRLTDGGPYAILTGELAGGMEILVATATLAAEAEGGATRASFILPGSRPLLIPPGGARWHLYGTGYGSVTLAWRGAYA